MPSFSFDKAYYDRFYRNAKTRVTGSSDMNTLGDFVASYLKHIGQTVETVIDMGCGIGLWRKEIKRHFPRASYSGVEVSKYMCKEHGWENASIVDYSTAQTFDLVICHGVLQYLNAKDARRAIANLARLSRGAVFVEALTREDWDHNCDRSVTDGDVFLRPASWYRKELGKRLTNCGGGLFLTAETDAVLYELEKLE